MKKFAIACATAALMSLAACGEQPGNEGNNVSNDVVVNVSEDNANAMDNAANATAEMSNAAPVNAAE